MRQRRKRLEIETKRAIKRKNEEALNNMKENIEKKKKRVITNYFSKL